jgi:hypothetical protein
MGGGNFVNLSLKAVVEMDKGTLTAFCPWFRHGTTFLCGAHSWGCAITSSSHILAAYRVAMGAGGIKVESGTGAWQ